MADEEKQPKEEVVEVPTYKKEGPYHNDFDYPVHNIHGQLIGPHAWSDVPLEIDQTPTPEVQEEAPKTPEKKASKAS